MRPSNLWIGLALIMAGLPCPGERAEAASVGKGEPAHVEPEPGTKFNRVILEPSAFKRLGIETTAVRETIAIRKRRVAAVVVDANEVEQTGLDAGPPNEIAAGARSELSPTPENLPATVAGRVWVRVLPIGDVPKVARDQPALLIPLAKGSESGKVRAHVVFPPISGGDGDGGLYCVVDGADTALAPKTPVLIELPYEATPRKAVPFSAVFYDEHGQAWVYTNLEPLTFIRHPIQLDYVVKDLAFLSEGPPVGTEVVTVGAPMLYGIEFGIGH
ncbi:hypothetical protein [Ensifer sp. BR816]|uniref:hypothetical protein n=1 Tax=Rhizobium sp. (strain BR816) TaxID=1057002 RepID=UPI000370B8BB|nr:hypothetical protein [Ensifer sp. BR816]